MYESFFGFVNRPFIASPSLERYFPSSAIEQTVQTATRVIARAEGPVAIFGGSGLGKTICCLRIAEQFKRSFDIVTLSSSALMTRRALLQSLLYELKLPYQSLSEGELRLSLVNRLQPSPEIATDGLLLMIDEAQVLPLKLLDEVRLLTNIQRNGLPRVRLVLCGNLKLEDTLCNPNMDSLNQRLATRCYLTPLSREETARYIVHKIELCGVNHQRVITPDALDALYRGSDGIPRLIDQLADQSMLIAAQSRTCPVTSDVVGKAWGMLQQLPNPWCEPEAYNAGKADHEDESDKAIEEIEQKTKEIRSAERIAAPKSESIDSSIIEYGGLDDCELDDAESDDAVSGDGHLYETNFYSDDNASIGMQHEEELLATEDDEIAGSEDANYTNESDTSDLFGSNFEEEYEIPFSSTKNLNDLSGIAFGQMNHDLEHFPVSKDLSEFKLEDAEEFFETSAVPFQRTSAQAQAQARPFLVEASVSSNDVTENSLENMVEEEMRELVSELNLSAMSFDPTQIIVELEPNDHLSDEFETEQDGVSYRGRHAFVQMRNEWNDGDVFSESSRAIASDDRDMLVIEEDTETVTQNKFQVDDSERLPKPMLHPYAKLFSNLRKS